MPAPSHDSTAPHRFQVNLSGLIELLSNHLYTRPDVFVRELLQNATDAISARMRLEPSHQGRVDIRLDDAMGTFTIRDSGIGLTEEEMHRFLAVIGESSKRGDLLGQPRDFIGQFGIGLLACFTVADEIELISRSITSPDAPTLRWRGRPDGTYDVATLSTPSEPGTTVRLVAKAASLPLFSFEALMKSAQYFGGVLPWPVCISHGETTQQANESCVAGSFPWDAAHLPIAEQADHRLDYGRRALGAEMLDAVPLHSPSGGVSGVAYVLKRTPAHTARSRHRVYLKRMLLSDSVDNLLPPWAFFVQCVVNCTGLHPSAARNAFVEDEVLQRTQQELGEGLRAYLVGLARHHPERLEELMGYHSLALKSLALEDDEFFRLFAPWFPFQTSQGRTTMQSYLARNQNIHYTRTVDEFRQIAQIAAAQGIEVVNGGYTYDAELLERYGELNIKTMVKAVQPSDIGHTLQGVSAEDEALSQPFIKAAQSVLQAFGCLPSLKRFSPSSLPVLFTLDRDAALSRHIAASREVADDLWAGVLDKLAPADQPPAMSKLSFNAANPLVERLLHHPDSALVQRVVQVLYVQSLLMGHHGLGRSELALMNEGLTGLLEWSVMGHNGGKPTWH
ncbi:MAG TPA: HSP90 family protein [Roseateles sp.]